MNILVLDLATGVRMTRNGFCEQCLIFGSHKGYHALNNSHRIGEMSSRFAVIRIGERFSSQQIWKTSD